MSRLSDAAKLFAPENDSLLVTCECGGTDMHPIAVRVNRGGEITTVESTGTSLSAGKASGRGVLIEVEFGCEHCRRSTRLVMQFHKGKTSAELMLSDKPAVGEEFPVSIWRD